MSIFTGAGVAIVTPMKANGEVNYPKLEELLNYQIENGTDAIIICGTTGESSTLTHEEHLEAIRFTIEKVAGESLSSQVLVPIVLRPQSICLRKRKNTAQMVCCWYLLIITKQLRKV